MIDDKDKQMLREIHSAVIGNPDLGHEGLVKQVARHEKWIKRLDTKFNRIAGGITVIVFLIELIFKK